MMKGGPVGGRGRSMHRVRWRWMLVLLTGIVPCPASGQDAPEAFRGVVRDALTLTPIEGALARVSGIGQSSLTARDGTFELPRTSGEWMEVTVEALGYRTMTLQVSTSDVPEPLQIMLDPAPLDVDGLDVEIATRFDLAGRVVDQVSGDGLLGAEVSLPYGSGPSGVLTRGAGEFELEDLSADVHLIRVSRVGYRPILFRTFLPGMEDTLRIPLEPDSAVLRGVARFRAERESRRRAVALTTVRSLSRHQIVTGSWIDSRQFLYRLGVLIERCPDSLQVVDCVRIWNEVRPALVCIDGRVAQGSLLELDSYRPSEIYLVESFGRGQMIEVTTTAYVERQARRSRPPRSQCPDPRLLR